MDFLTKFGLEKSRLTVLVMLGLLIMGAVTYTQLPKLENPAITIRTAVVSASFSGMSPDWISVITLQFVWSSADISACVLRSWRRYQP